MYQAESTSTGPVWHATVQRRRYATNRLTISGTLFTRVIARFLPWKIYHYPGIGRGARELLGERLTNSQIASMSSGRQKMPVAVALFLAGQLQERIKRDQALIQELNSYVENFKDGRAETMARGRATMAARKRGLSL